MQSAVLPLHFPWWWWGSGQVPLGPTWREPGLKEPYLLLDAPLLLLVESVPAAELSLSVLQFPGLVGREQSLC